MKHWIGLWLFCLPLWASAQTLTPEQAREDFRYLKKKLDGLYPGVGYYLPEAAYEKLYDSLSRRITGPVDYLGFYRETATPFVSALKDGHLSVYHRKNYATKTFRSLPFDLRQAGNSYYLLGNYSPDTSLKRGAELLKLNGRPLADVHRELMEYQRLGSDGDNETGRRTWSQLYFSTYYARWFGACDSVRLEYRLPGDSLIRQTCLPCLTVAQKNQYAAKRYRGEAKSALGHLKLRVIDSLPQTAILRVETFSNAGKDLFGLQYQRKLRKAFTEIKAKNTQNLIVDLRSNGGGRVLNAARLLRYWVPEPFHVMKPGEMKRGARSVLVQRWNPFAWALFSVFYKRHPSGGFVERRQGRPYRPERELAYRGNLYFLMNGASYSATTSVLVHTLNAGLGTFVGEATGGAYWGDFAGQFQSITLPHSRMQVRVPLKILTHSVDPKRANGFTVEPDFQVDRTPEDVQKARDHALLHTLKLIRQGTLAERATQRSVATK